MSDVNFNDLEPMTPEATETVIEMAANPVVTRTDECGEKGHTLLCPLVVDGADLTRVVVRLPTLGDFDDLASGAIDGSRALLCRLTGLHPAVIKGLAWPDAEAVNRIFADLVPDIFADLIHDE